MKDKSERIQNIADSVEEQLLTDFFKEMMRDIKIEDMPVELAFTIFQHFSNRFTKIYDPPLFNLRGS